jgi:hypothetical protein
MMLLTVIFLVVPLATTGCGEEATRILDPEPAGDPAGEPAVPNSLDESPPIANAGPDLRYGDLDEDGLERVTLDGCGSEAGSSPIAGYLWTERQATLDRTEGEPGCSLAVDMEVGVHAVTLTVTDEAGRTAMDRVAVDVRKPYPALRIDTPEDGSAFATGSVVQFRALARDWRGETIEGEHLVWESDLDGQLGSGATIKRSDLAKGHHLITTTVTDSEGFTTSKSMTVLIGDPPVVTILTPEDGQTCASFDEMRFEGSCVDGNGDPITGPGFQWERDDIDIWLGEERKHERSIVIVCSLPGPETISLSCTDANGITSRAEVTVEYLISYRFNVRAVLEDFGCTSCHGSSRQDGGVRLDTHLALTTGSTGNGPLIVPGDSARGILIPKLHSAHHDPDWQTLTTPFYWGWVDPSSWGSLAGWWVHWFLGPWIENGAQDN